MKTARQAREEQLKLHPRLKPRDPVPVISMIVPGRRALGEQWSRVTIGHDGDEITIEREDAAAPADNKPIMAVTGPDAEYARYILEAQAEKAQARAVAPQELTREERFEALNAAWHAYMEQKLRWLNGQTTIGPAGMHQRQRVYQNPATRPLRSV